MVTMVLKRERVGFWEGQLAEGRWRECGRVLGRDKDDDVGCGEDSEEAVGRSSGPLPTLWMPSIVTGGTFRVVRTVRMESFGNLKLWKVLWCDGFCEGKRTFREEMGVDMAMSDSCFIVNTSLF